MLHNDTNWKLQFLPRVKPTQYKSIIVTNFALKKKIAELENHYVNQKSELIDRTESNQLNQIKSKFLNGTRHSTSASGTISDFDDSHNEQPATLSLSSLANDYKPELEKSISKQLSSSQSVSLSRSKSKIENTESIDNISLSSSVKSTTSPFPDTNSL